VYTTPNVAVTESFHDAVGCTVPATMKWAMLSGMRGQVNESSGSGTETANARSQSPASQFRVY
jgi:hypothetical protein